MPGRHPTGRPRCLVGCVVGVWVAGLGVGLGAVVLGAVEEGPAAVVRGVRSVDAGGFVVEGGSGSGGWDGAVRGRRGGFMSEVTRSTESSDASREVF